LKDKNGLNIKFSEIVRINLKKMLSRHISIMAPTLNQRILGKAFYIT